MKSLYGFIAVGMMLLAAGCQQKEKPQPQKAYKAAAAKSVKKSEPKKDVKKDNVKIQTKPTWQGKYATNRPGRLDAGFVKSPYNQSLGE